MTVVEEGVSLLEDGIRTGGAAGGEDQSNIQEQVSPMNLPSR